MRTKLAIAVLTGFLLFTGMSATVFGWYGYRVFTELTPGSWKAPTEVLDRNGKTIVALYGAEWRVAEPVTLSALPDYVPNAFLAAEDSRFRSHIGIDPIGIGRAAVTNVVAGGVTEGGSTITQQLAKTRFLSNRRTFSRKFVEMGIALMIEARLTKDEILEAYLNEVYLGHRDGREVRGLGEAARVYFSKTPEKLTVAEAALLAGIIRAPNRDNPDERARIAKQRRDAVLAVMLDKKWIDKPEHDKAVAAAAEFNAGSRRSRPHPYLLAALRQEFIDNIGARRLAQGGLKIRTAVDVQMQVTAERAVRTGTANLRRAHGFLRRSKPLQAALLSIEPASGGIRALVGGSDFSRSQFDRTRRMKRQPGSAAKPFTYAAAIASRRITPATIVQDEPFKIQLARNRTWDPKNYDGMFRGPVTVREAFEKSLNVPAVRVANDVGVDRVQEVWHEVGIEGDLSSTPAIALGVDDITMRDLAAAYSVFPNLGARSEPHLIESVTEADGDEIYRYEVDRREAIDPAVAYVIHALMRGVVIRGTAAGLNQYGLSYVAGKTGTTSNYRDAWFVGYTPDLLTAAWVGFDDGTPLRMSSGEAVIPMWGWYMSRVPHSRQDIGAPQGVSVVEVEAATGRVWQPGCGPSVVEAFLQGTEPRDPCGGFYDGTQSLTIYMEPGVFNDSMAMPEFDQTYNQIEAVDDPDLADMSMVDTATEVNDEDDTVSVRPPVITPPEVRPPVVRPPVDSAPRPRPPAREPAPPPRDSLEDSITVGGDSATLSAQHVPYAFIFGSKHPYGESAHFLFLREIELGLESADILEKEPFIESTHHVARERDLLYGIPLNLRSVPRSVT
jgi:penicillin-binding protein 1B